MANKRNLRKFFTKAELLDGISSFCANSTGVWSSTEADGKSVANDYLVHAVRLSQGRLYAEYREMEQDGVRTPAREIEITESTLAMVVGDLAPDLFRALDGWLMKEKADMLFIDIGRFNAPALDGAVKRIDQLLSVLEEVGHDRDAVLVAQEALSEGLLLSVNSSRSEITAEGLRDDLTTSRNVIVRLVEEARSEYSKELFASSEAFYREYGPAEVQSDYPRHAILSYLKTQGFTAERCRAIADGVIDERLRGELAEREAERASVFHSDVLFLDTKPSTDIRSLLSMIPTGYDMVVDARMRQGLTADPMMKEDNLRQVLMDHYGKGYRPAPSLFTEEGKALSGDIDTLVDWVEQDRSVIILHDRPAAEAASRIGQELFAWGASAGYRTMDSDGSIKTRSHESVIKELVGEQALEGKALRSLRFDADGGFHFEQVHKTVDPMFELLRTDAAGVELFAGETLRDEAAAAWREAVRGALVDRPFVFRDHCFPQMSSRDELYGAPLLIGQIVCAAKGWSVPMWFPTEAMSKVGIDYDPSKAVPMVFSAPDGQMKLKMMMNAGYLDDEESPVISHFEEMNRETYGREGRFAGMYEAAIKRFSETYPDAPELDTVLAKLYFATVTLTEPGPLRLSQEAFEALSSRSVFDAFILTGSRCESISRDLMLSLRMGTSIRAVRDSVEEHLSDGKDSSAEAETVAVPEQSESEGCTY